jgi:hypothetical protein
VISQPFHFDYVKKLSVHIRIEMVGIVYAPKLMLRNNNLNRRLSINRPTKSGKEKSPSDSLHQCEKEMDDHLLACQQILEREPHSDTRC